MNGYIMQMLTIYTVLEINRYNDKMLINANNSHVPWYNDK